MEPVGPVSEYCTKDEFCQCAQCLLKVRKTKTFQCEYCPKSFSVKENLNVHMRSHTKEKPYICHVCNKGFEHSGKLHRHIRTHTGERPHQCELCDKSFVQSGQLVIHMRAHTGEKPYTCEYCNKGFTCSKQLKVHIRIHTGEKPYQCDLCGKTFGYNHVLKMHKRSHLATKMYKCSLCNEFFNTRKSFDRHIKLHNKDQCDDNDTSSKVTAEGFAKSNFSAAEGTLTPPYSPKDHEFDRRERSCSASDQEIFNPYYSLVSRESVHGGKHALTFLTTADGEKLVCPSKFLIKISDPMDAFNIRMIENEIDHLIKEEGSMKAEEDEFCSSVVKVLQTCLGESKLRKLGYPSSSIDEVIVQTLRHLGAEPCVAPSINFINRLKINLKLLLDLCVPDPALWDSFGWKDKSIDQIICEILDQSSQSVSY